MSHVPGILQSLFAVVDFGGWGGYGLFPKGIEVPNSLIMSKPQRTKHEGRFKQY